MPRIEVLPNTGSAPAPGWAYVADTGYDPSKVAINPTGTGKRATRAGAGGAGAGEISAAALQIKLTKRLNQLDSDVSSKEVNIPAKKAGVAFKGGSTPATRKILMSGKRFDNYLADEEAEIRNAPQPGPRSARAIENRRASALSRTPLAGSQAQTPAPQPMDIDEQPAINSLLHSDVPKAPTSEEIDALLAAPPLSYNASRVAPPDPRGPPIRHFCAMCGYWGRVRCLKCGDRVCGLECKQSHDAVCSQFG